MRNDIWAFTSSVRVNLKFDWTTRPYTVHCDLFNMYSAQACKSAMPSRVAFYPAVYSLCGILSVHPCKYVPTVSSDNYYAPQLYRQVLLRRVLAMAILSVCLSVCPSVCHNPVPNKPRWDRDFGSSPYGSLENLVSYEVIWCHWVKRFPSNEGIKEGYPP